MPLHTALPHFMLMTDLERLLKDMHGDNVAKVVDGRLKEPKRRSALSPDEIYHVVIITFKRQRPDFLRADAAGIRKISG
jgi:hypothetical protein